ncbi:MAG: thrombospondin type 3 repeat-containing protein, partial [Thalassolituus sp.]
PADSYGYRVSDTRTEDLYELGCNDDGLGGIDWNGCKIRDFGTIDDVINTTRYQCETEYLISDDGHIYRSGEDIGEWQRETVGGYEALFFPLGACQFAPDNMLIGYTSVDGVLIDIGKTPAGSVNSSQGPTMLNATASAAVASMLEQLLPLTLEEYGCYDCEFFPDTDGDGYSDYEELEMGTDPYNSDSYPGSSSGDGSGSAEGGQPVMPVSQENRGQIQPVANVVAREVTSLNAATLFEDGFSSYWKSSMNTENILTFSHMLLQDINLMREEWTGSGWQQLYDGLITAHEVMLTPNGWTYVDGALSCDYGAAVEDTSLFQLSCPGATTQFAAQGIQLDGLSVAEFFITLLENGNYGEDFGSLTEEQLQSIRDEMTGDGTTFTGGQAFTLTASGETNYKADCWSWDENGTPTECNITPFSSLAEMQNTVFFSNECEQIITLTSEGEVIGYDDTIVGSWMMTEPFDGFPVLEVQADGYCDEPRLGFAEINGSVVEIEIIDANAPSEIFFDRDAAQYLDLLIMEYFPMASAQVPPYPGEPTLNLPELTPTNAEAAFTSGITELTIESNEDQSGFELERLSLSLGDSQLTSANEYWDGSEWLGYTGYRAALVHGEWQSISIASDCQVLITGDLLTLFCENSSQVIGVNSVSLDGVAIKDYLRAVAWDRLEGEGFSYDTFNTTLDYVDDALFSSDATAYSISGRRLSSEIRLDCDADESGIDCSDADSYGVGTLEETMTSTFNECGDDFQFTSEGLLQNGNLVSSVEDY